ncbi:hypothetical protein [Viridibacillus arvi]|uniref:hypothetical protein n=1 Tax=Viridibacillus arvi TaxID=263475 RepID=UPI0034CE52ED
MKQIAWINVYHREYSMNEITDDYLKNILNFIYRGGGYDQFLTVEKVADLFAEANRRGIKLRFNINSLIDARFHSYKLN